jgi:hypothetical protein
MWWYAPIGKELIKLWYDSLGVLTSFRIAADGEPMGMFAVVWAEGSHKGVDVYLPNALTQASTLST